MPWQKNLSSDTGKSFSADEQATGPAEADTSHGTETCPACPVDLVLVEFADKPGSNLSFPGLRAQYVNMSSADLVGVDPEVKSAHQLERTPPIVVKVVPPQAKTVTLRLVREERAHGFPGGSETLSTREKGLAHLTWPVATSSVTTDAKGEGKLEPGIAIPALGGYKFKVEGSIDGKPYVRSSNAVNVRRRLAIRPVVRYAAGKAAAFTAMSSIQGDLANFDIETFQTATLTGGNLGVREENELAISLIDMGNGSLDAPPEVKAFRPHAVSIIVGEFITDPITAIPFEGDLARASDGRFPRSVNMPLSSGGFSQIIVPLTNGSQFQGADVTYGTPPVTHPLNPAEVTGTNRFSSSVQIDLSRFQALPASVTTITISVKLKTISSWAVGWAYNSHPVIYLNMRDPNTDTILAADMAAALVIHELGHKLHLTSTAASGQPDQQPHHYPSFDTNGVAHQGPHCSTGVPAGTDLWTSDAQNKATCTMWGSLKTIRAFCSECQTTLRKVDLSSGF